MDFKNYIGHHNQRFQHKMQILSNDVLIYSCGDFRLKIWDLTKETHEHEVKDLIKSEGPILNHLICYENKKIKTYNLKKHLSGEYDHKNIILEGHTDMISALKLLSHDQLASGSLDHTIRIWNLRTAECTRVLTGHSSAISTLEIQATGELVSGSWDKTLRIWNIEKCECLKRLIGHNGPITCLKLIERDGFEFLEYK